MSAVWVTAIGNLGLEVSDWAKPFCNESNFNNSQTI